ARRLSTPFFPLVFCPIRSGKLRVRSSGCRTAPARTPRRPRGLAMVTVAGGWCAVPRRIISLQPERRWQMQIDVDMKVSLWDIAQIKPYDNNPRRNDQAVEAVARSIEAFGFRQPLVVDAQGKIVVGETRFKAALKLGLKQVPVHVAMGLTAAQAKA